MSFDVLIVFQKTGCLSHDISMVKIFFFNVTLHSDMLSNNICYGKMLDSNLFSIQFTKTGLDY